MSEERRLKILVRFGELTLKSDRSRRRFLRRLIQNIRDALNTLGYKYEIENLWSRLLIDVYGDINDAVEALRRVFGIHSLAIVSDRYFDGLDDLVRLGVEEFKDAVRGRSFAVRVKRVGRHNFTSMDVARLLGSELLKYADRVDLTSPDVEVRLEIRDDRVFFYHGLVKAYGGLPIGTEGVAVALVSGGFDSAVAAWYALKRGAIVHYVFCNLDGEGYKMDVIKVLKVLSDKWSYGYMPKLYVIDFTGVLDELRKTREDYWNVILKRMMYRAAERIAKKLRAGTIITGESLGQVSSQTMKNLFVSQRAVETPINRPLFGLDKEEIIDMAREIGTYELSARVQEYCAIVPEKPILSASLRVVEEEESKLDMSKLWEALESAEVINLRKYRPKPMDEYGVDTIPCGAEVIDVRDEESYGRWHYPGAINIPAEELRRDPDRYLSKDREYVIYCEKGVLSRELAYYLRAMGYKVYYFIYGLPRLKKICELARRG